MSRKDDRVDMMDSFISDLEKSFPDSGIGELMKKKFAEEKEFRSKLDQNTLDVLDGKKPLTTEYIDGTTIDHKAGR